MKYKMLFVSIIVVVFNISSFAKVAGIINSQSVSAIDRMNTNNMMTEETNNIISLIDGSLGDAIKKRYINSKKKYILARKIKEIKKKKYMLKKEEIYKLKRLVKLQCLLLNKQIADIDKRINDILEKYIMAMLQSKLYSLKNIYFFTQLYPIILSISQK